MIDIEIRQAKIEDAPVLASAEREIARTPGFLASRPHELTDGKFAAKIEQLSTADNGRYVVAVRNGEIVGHAIFDPLQLESTRHVVHLTLVVHPGWQRQGIGKLLLEHLMDWARSAPSVEKAELHVRSSNPGAIELYREMGFVEEGRLKRRVKVGPGQYVDDIVMGIWVG